MENKIIRVEGTRKENLATNDKVFPHFLRVREQITSRQQAGKKVYHWLPSAFIECKWYRLPSFFGYKKKHICVLYFFIPFPHAWTFNTLWKKKKKRSPISSFGHSTINTWKEGRKFSRKKCNREEDEMKS